MLSKVGIWIVVLGISNAVAWAADPQVYLTWDESPPPVEGVAYVIDDADPAYPSVELVIGSQTWRIWSVDPDNPGGVGDIGVINCPHAENFGIKILTPTGGQGARDVLGMNLQPTSGSNYSRIVDGIFSTLQGNVTLQKTSGGTGGTIGSLTVGIVAAETTLSIPGGITGDVVIDLVDEYAVVDIGSIASDEVTLALAEEATLTITEVGSLTALSVSQVAGPISIYQLDPSSSVTISKFEPTGSLDVTKMEDDSALFLSNMNCDSGSGNALVHVADMYGTAVVDVRCPGLLEVLEPECSCGTSTPKLALTIDQMSDDSIVQYPDGLGAQEQLEIGAMAGESRVDCGTLKGTINLSGGIGAGCMVDIANSDYGSVIDLNDEAVAGTLKVNDTVRGQIANGGDVSGSVYLSSVTAGGPIYFAGNATFGNVSGSIITGPFGGSSYLGQLVVTGNLSGDIEVNGDVSGSIMTHGDITSTGEVDVLGDLIGGAVTVAQDLESGGHISVNGAMTSADNIQVFGVNRGLIHVSETMNAQAFIQAHGGLDTGSMIDVNTSGGSTSTTAGTIWVGGSASQNPLPSVLMLGAVRVNCPALSKTFNGQVKVVGCASATHQSADICIFGTIQSSRPILYVDKNCTYKYGTSCTTGCGS